VFVTKLDVAGASLAYSTFLPGFEGAGIAVDANGNAYVTGSTYLDAFPTTPGAYDTTPNGDFDAFAAKLNTTGSGLVYSTLLGGADEEFAYAIAVDANGDAYVAGHTRSNDFPTTAGALRTTFISFSDSFLTKLNPTGSSLSYSTYIGGQADEIVESVAVDSGGNAYMTGVTNSADFPTTPGVFDTTYNDGAGLGNPGDAFVSKLNASGSSLSYSSFLGGYKQDWGEGIAVDASREAYVTGLTDSNNFPTTPGAVDTGFDNYVDPFVAKLDETGSTLRYSTFLGVGYAYGIAVDGGANAYVTGHAGSNFPITPGAFDQNHGASEDAFVTKLSTSAGPPATLALTPETATNTVDSQHCLTATVTDASGTPTPGTTVVFTVSQTNRATGSATTDASGQASFCYEGELFGTDQITAFADFDPEDGSQQASEPGDSASKTWLLAEGTPCRVSNGGSIVAGNGDRASFAGIATQSSPSRVAGYERYRDQGPAPPRAARSTELLTLSCAPDAGAASIFGRARAGSVGQVNFRIDVVDHGRPGRGRDSYRILL